MDRSDLNLNSDFFLLKTDQGYRSKRKVEGGIKAHFTEFLDVPQFLHCIGTCIHFQLQSRSPNYCQCVQVDRWFTSS